MVSYSAPRRQKNANLLVLPHTVDTLLLLYLGVRDAGEGGQLYTYIFERSYTLMMQTDGPRRGRSKRTAAFDSRRCRSTVYSAWSKLWRHSVPRMAIMAAALIPFVFSATIAISSPSSPACLESPLLKHEVDPTTYDIGCEEIEDMLQRNSTLFSNGYYRNVYLVKSKERVVVVKTLRNRWKRPSQLGEVTKMVRWEAVALDSVKGDINIVSMLGFCGLSMVSKYYPDQLEARIKSWETEKPPVWKVAAMALDGVRALRALHEAPGGPIVHFDIKPEQFLIDGDDRMMLNDLNMAKFMSTSSSTGDPCPFTTKNAPVPQLWRSPEDMAGEALTEKVDIYSMAMVLYTMLSGKLPFELDSDVIIGNTPFVDPSWHRGYMEIVEDMWHREPKERPSAREAVTRFEALLSDLAGHLVNEEDITAGEVQIFNEAAVKEPGTR